MLTHGAYYNDNDPQICAWLRELIKAGLVAPGEVDERSIKDVSADDLNGFTQYHFFAGIGGWSYALRLAGWPDDQPVWTGSCPCPPFSSAGKKFACPECGKRNLIPCPRRTGYFICCLCRHSWLADERHLWPEFWRLIRDCRPGTVFGEQVAGKDGRKWLSGVRASLEILGYAVGAADLCAAGVGSPQIRQRLWWVSYAGSNGREQSAESVCGRQSEPSRSGEVSGIPDPRNSRRRQESARESGEKGTAESNRYDPIGHISPGRLPGTMCSRRTERGAESRDGPTSRAGKTGGLHNAERRGRQARGPTTEAQSSEAQPDTGYIAGSGNNPWDEFDVLEYVDGEARRVEPGIFPLAHGVSARVLRLRGYGNAINPQTAATFIRAVM